LVRLRVRSLQIRLSTENLTLFRNATNEWITNKSTVAATDWTVIYDLASCVNAACSRTRITTFISGTTFVERAVSVNDTFRPAIWWTSNVTSNARTNGNIVDLSALRIRTARGRLTWIDNRFFMNYWDTTAGLKWISSEAAVANTVRRMVDDMAVCVGAAHTGTRIFALVVDTSLTHRAFAIHHAFRSASHVWITMVTRDARTRASITKFLANCIRSARVASAWTFWRQVCD
jgi:hypothetical protein